MAIWRMRIACWIPKATDIHAEYVILVALTIQRCLHEPYSMLPYTYFACIVTFTYIYRGANKSLARPTSRCILFDGENISFDATLVIYIYIYIYKQY